MPIKTIDLDSRKEKRESEIYHELGIELQKINNQLEGFFEKYGHLLFSVSAKTFNAKLSGGGMAIDINVLAHAVTKQVDEEIT